MPQFNQRLMTLDKNKCNENQIDTAIMMKTYEIIRCIEDDDLMHIYLGNGLTHLQEYPERLGEILNLIHQALNEENTSEQSETIFWNILSHV